MKRRITACLLLLAAAAALRAQAVLDRAEEALAASTPDGRLRARLSGVLDLEEYSFAQPPPALIEADGHRLFVPRLSVFLDAQEGEQVYLFAQVRADRGFDPTDEHGEVRLDEYAVRIRPTPQSPFNLQVGKFATIVGSWSTRHTSWTNPFVTAPMLYEHLTGMWDMEAVRSSTQLLQWSHVRGGLPASIVAREKYLRLPIIWGPSYTPGAAVSAEIGHYRFGVEVKSAALASRPDTWTPANTHWDYPTTSARIAYRPNAAWEIGISGSAGSYLRPEADRTTLARHGRGDHRELLIGQDTSFAWHHLQIWTEVYLARFEVPLMGNADTLAYYAEAKYRFTPRFSAALRWNEELFGTIPDRFRRTRWGKDASRLDFAPAWRLTAHTQFKLQYNLQRGDNPSRRQTEQTAAGQLSVRF